MAERDAMAGQTEPEELSLPSLIAAFFAALDLRNLERCRAIIQQMQQMAASEAPYGTWSLYFGGILANEQEHDWAKAEQIFTNLLQHEVEPPLRARTLLALGRTCEYQGRWHEAVAAHRDALQLFRQLDQPIDQAKAYKNMAVALWKGFIQSDLGSEVLAQASGWCEEALALLPAGSERTPDVEWLAGSIWNMLGLLYRCRGQWQDALDAFHKDLAICQALDDRHGMGLTYGNLGEIYQKLGPSHWPSALDAFTRALALIQEFDNRYDEIEALANLAYFYQESGDLSRSLAYYEQAIGVVESLRSGISSEAARSGFFATIVDLYANALLVAHAAGETARAFAFAEQARARSLLDLLARDALENSPEPETQTPEMQPLALADVQAALEEDALLLAYFTTGLEESRLDRAASHQGIQRHRFPPPRTLLFAITRHTATLHDLALSPNSLRPRHLASVVERHFLQPQIRRTLYNHLLRPVRDLLAQKRRVYLVPHGPLHYIPFVALIDEQGTALLQGSGKADGPLLIHGLSATALLRRKRPRLPRPAQSCLALGYNGESKPAAGVEVLHFAEEEAQSIACLMQGTAWTGAAPKKAALFAGAEDYRILHISCHGLFNPTAPLASALHLGAGEHLTVREALEELHLRCDLATLSACESGLSLVRRGDELVGLLGAFLRAGASAVIATLWRVDERSTRLLMEHFYQAIQTRQAASYAEALQSAQRYLMGLTVADLPAAIQQEVAHLPNIDATTPIFDNPYYWAPFILVGDARIASGPQQDER